MLHYSSLSAGVRIRRLFSAEEKDSFPQNGCHGDDTTLYLMVMLEFSRSKRVRVTPSLSLLSGSLCPEVAVSIRVSSMNLIDFFKNYHYWTRIHETVQLCRKYLY